jgi:hypothetical protein
LTEVAVKQGAARREEELLALVMKREDEAAAAIAKCEEEITFAADAACLRREELYRTEVEAWIQWVLAKENELKAEEVRLEEVKTRGGEKRVGGDSHRSGKRFVKPSCLGVRLRSWVRNCSVGQKEKRPLKEVKNLFEPMARMRGGSRPTRGRRCQSALQPELEERESERQG